LIKWVDTLANSKSRIPPDSMFANIHVLARDIVNPVRARPLVEFVRVALLNVHVDHGSLKDWIAFHHHLGA